MDAKNGESNIERLEEKVRIRGARVVESFTVTTKDKRPEELVNYTEAIIDAKNAGKISYSQSYPHFPQ